MADLFMSIAAAVGVLILAALALQYLVPIVLPMLGRGPAAAVIRFGLLLLVAWLVGSMWLGLHFGLMLVVWFVLLLVMLKLPGGRR